ncbi:hypothetical protein ACTMTJ_27455 [Phytohabitans sp. LJ34]|uniref:hypothetical protein n=1 Tax=Phytohabitans sp. LJ34 TaxID=3452217 RepID=UPI003F8C8954
MSSVGSVSLAGRAAMVNDGGDVWRPRIRRKARKPRRGSSLGPLIVLVIVVLVLIMLSKESGG